MSDEMRRVMWEGDWSTLGGYAFAMLGRLLNPIKGPG